jgi:hypothetical protein
MKMAAFCVIALCSMVMMEAASTSETSVNFYQTTWCNNPEDNHLHTHNAFVKTALNACLKNTPDFMGMVQ